MSWPPCPAVIAMIASAGVSILVTAIWSQTSLTGLSQALSSANLRAFIIFVGAMVLLIRFKKNPIQVMLLSGVAEVAYQMVMKVVAA